MRDNRDNSSVRELQGAFGPAVLEVASGSSLTQAGGVLLACRYFAFSLFMIMQGLEG